MLSLNLLLRDQSCSQRKGTLVRCESGWTDQVPFGGLGYLPPALGRSLAHRCRRPVPPLVLPRNRPGNSDPALSSEKVGFLYYVVDDIKQPNCHNR